MTHLLSEAEETPGQRHPGRGVMIAGQDGACDPPGERAEWKRIEDFEEVH